MSLLVSVVGPAALVGVAYMIIAAPLAAITFKKIKALQEKTLQVTDQRVKLMGDVLSGIRVAKVYAWEAAFSVRQRA